MKPLGLLVVLCSLASKGFCISCINCWHMQGMPCNGLSQPCSDDQLCVASFTITTIDPGTTRIFQYSLSCGSRSECNMNGSLTYNRGKLRTGTSCCDTDNCIPPFPILPNESSQKNGLICTTCASETSSYCITREKIECTGEEIKCGRMARNVKGTISKNDALRGCTTKSYCGLLGNQMYTIQEVNVIMKMYCTDGAVALQVGLFRPAFAVLLTMLLL
uniref:Phospholipase A2 inhibitor and Ly6/PLAUR domain-containing protein-like n=1 Tax=Pyxicephalus adspersus TaxID=30357 RepID=A0AAV2ZKI5_PYXAD|nr:TPA: hypothetical protein GDO54_003254 [Pyxicephalus adspersus]